MCGVEAPGCLERGRQERFHGSKQERIEHWLRIAAQVPGFIGYAVGHTTFWQSLVDVDAQRLSKEGAAMHFAHNFEAWIHLFEQAHSAQGA